MPFFKIKIESDLSQRIDSHQDPLNEDGPLHWLSVSYSGRRAVGQRGEENGHLEMWTKLWMQFHIIMVEMEQIQMGKPYGKYSP